MGQDNKETNYRIRGPKQKKKLEQQGKNEEKKTKIKKIKQQEIF